MVEKLGLLSVISILLMRFYHGWLSFYTKETLTQTRFYNNTTEVIKDESAELSETELVPCVCVRAHTPTDLEQQYDCSWIHQRFGSQCDTEHHAQTSLAQITNSALLGKVVKNVKMCCRGNIQREDPSTCVCVCVFLYVQSRERLADGAGACWPQYLSGCLNTGSEQCMDPGVT